MAGKEQFSVRGKTAVITGAARGLGLASAQLLSKIEANIAVLDIITQTKPWSGSTESGVQVEYYKTDITNGQEVTQIIEQIQEAFGSIGSNTNAACIVTDKPFLTHLDKNLSSTFVNVTLLYAPTISLQSAIADRSKSTGSFLVAKRAHFCGPPTATTPFSRSTHELSGGFIVFIGSIAAHISTTVQHMLAHAASEAAVRRLIKPSVMELAHHGTCVNSLSPGYTMADMMTDMMRGLQVRQPEPVKRGDAVRADGVFRRAESGHIVDVQRGWAMAHRAGYAD